MNIPQTIEAILFFKGEPLSVSYLSKLLGKNEDEIKSAFEELKNSLEGRGIVAVIEENSISLGTHPEVATLIEQLAKEEAIGPLTPASLETLSIILYRSPITKSEIDYIRGVNSGFILRALLMRGLVEKTNNPKDARTFLYTPTADLYAHLGIRDKKELPEFEEYNAKIQTALKEYGNESYS